MNLFWHEIMSDLWPYSRMSAINNCSSESLVRHPRFQDISGLAEPWASWSDQTLLLSIPTEKRDQWLLHTPHLIPPNTQSEGASISKLLVRRLNSFQNALILHFSDVRNKWDHIWSFFNFSPLMNTTIIIVKQIIFHPTFKSGHSVLMMS